MPQRPIAFLSAALCIATTASASDPTDDDECMDSAPPAWQAHAQFEWPSGWQDSHPERMDTRAFEDATVTHTPPEDFPDYPARCEVRRSDGAEFTAHHCRLVFAGDLNADGATDFGFDIVDFPGCTGTQTLLSTPSGWTSRFAEPLPTSASDLPIGATPSEPRAQPCTGSFQGEPLTAGTSLFIDADFPRLAMSSGPSSAAPIVDGSLQGVHFRRPQTLVASGRVSCAEETRNIHGRQQSGHWLEVQYSDDDQQTLTGWIYDRYLTRKARDERTPTPTLDAMAMRWAGQWLDPFTGTLHNTPRTHRTSARYTMGYSTDPQFDPPPIVVSRDGEPVGTLPAEPGEGWHGNTVWGDLVMRTRLQGDGHLHIVMYRATGERLWARDYVVPAPYDRGPPDPTREVLKRNGPPPMLDLLVTGRITTGRDAPMSSTHREPTLTIGDVASTSGVPAKTIRYYEQIGLLPKPQRAANGYRLYDADAVDRLRFIRRARDLGFPIANVTELLAMYEDPNRASADVRAVATAHIAAVDAKLAELNALRETLSALVARCPGSDDPNCPILHDLTQHAESA